MSTSTGDIGPQHTGPREGACDDCGQRGGRIELHGDWLCLLCFGERARADQLQRQEDERMEEQEERLYVEAIAIARDEDGHVTVTSEHVRVLWDRMVWVTGRIEQMKQMIANASGDLRKAVDAHLGHQSRDNNADSI